MFTRIGHLRETGLGVVCLDTATDMDEVGKKIVGRVSEEGFDLAQGQKLRAGQSLKFHPVKGFTSRVHVWAWENLNILKYIKS